jgi:hypothetical protein
MAGNPGLAPKEPRGLPPAGIDIWKSASLRKCTPPPKLPSVIGSRYRAWNSDETRMRQRSEFTPLRRGREIIFVIKIITVISIFVYFGSHPDARATHQPRGDVTSPELPGCPLKKMAAKECGSDFREEAGKAVLPCSKKLKELFLQHIPSG